MIQPFPYTYYIRGERAGGLSIYFVQLYVLGAPRRGWFRFTLNSAIAKGEREVARAVKKGAR